MRWDSRPQAMCGLAWLNSVVEQTEVSKTHKTGLRRAVYPWHPLHGIDLSVAGTMNRRGALMFICQADGLPAPLAEYNLAVSLVRRA